MDNNTLHKLKIIISDKPYIRKCPATSGILILDNKLKETSELAPQIDSPRKNNRKKKKNMTNIQKVCHNCSSDMEKTEYMYSSGIFIHRCPSCDAVWLDKGELTKIYKLLNGLDKYDKEIKKLTPAFIEIQQDVNETFRKIKEDSNPYRKKKD